MYKLTYTNKHLGKKDPTKERDDLLKAVWYLHRKIDQLDHD